MANTMTGSCLCGALRFEARGEPLFQGFCQCLDCRKVTSGHYAAIGMLTAGVTITGESRRYGSKGDSGHMIYRNFCPTCGSTVFDQGDDMPDVTVINAALLDDPQAFQPQSVIYTRSALPWDYIDPGLPRFAAMPPTD